MEIIRQTEYLSNIPLQKKLATLEELYHRPGNPFSVHELCDALDVARGTFYNHIFRKADRSQYQEEQAQLMLKVKQVFDDSEQRFGAEKIRIVLAESGIRVGKKRISAIMQELGLCSVRIRCKKAVQAQATICKTKSAETGVFGRVIQIRYGSAILHTSRSKATGSVSVSFWIYTPARLSAGGYQSHMSTHLVTRNLQNHLSGARESRRT